MDNLNLNEKLLLWINQDWANPVFDILFQWLSLKAGFSIPLILGVILFIGWRYGKPGWRLGLFIIAVIAVGDSLGNLLKDVFQHPRPCLEFGDLIRSISGDDSQCATSTSGMPSNHALNFFSVFAFLCYFFPKTRVIIPSLTIAILVSVSRIYLGAHFPSQVLTGAIIGLILGFSLAALSRKLLPILNFNER